MTKPKQIKSTSAHARSNRSWPLIEGNDDRTYDGFVTRTYGKVIQAIRDVTLHLHVII
jgi:hypothetical protein